MPRDDTDFTTSTFNQIVVDATTVSSSAATGCVVLAGGLGIGGALNVTGTITGGAIVYASTSTGTLDVTDSPGLTMTVQSTEQATSTITGCATFDGGVGIAKNLHVGGTLVAGAITYASTSTGTMEVTDSPGLTLTVDSTEDSTSKTTGCATFIGGIGVGKSIYGASLNTTDTTQSTSTTTGSIISGGGVGVAGNIYAGGKLDVDDIDTDNIGINAVSGTTLNVSSTSDATSGGSNGAAIFFGGVTIVKTTRSGDIEAFNTTASTTTTTGALQSGGGLGVVGDINMGGDLAGANAAFTGGVVNGGFDFILGNTDQSTRGNSGASRAFVKDTGNILAINFGGDFTGGTRIDGPSELGIVDATTITTTGLADFASLNVSGTATFATAEFPSLTVTGTSTLADVDAVDITDTGSTVLAEVGVSGLSSLTTLGVTGLSSLTTLGVSGASNLTTLGVSGLSSLTTLGVSSTTNLAGATITGTTDMVTVDVSGSSTFVGMTVNGTATFNANTIVDNTLNVSGIATFTNNIIAGLITNTTTASTNVNCTDLTVSNDALVSGAMAVDGFDITLGKGDQVTRGDSGLSRALVKESGATLVINFAGDYGGGVQVQSDLDVTGTFTPVAITASGTATFNGTLSSTSSFISSGTSSLASPTLTGTSLVTGMTVSSLATFNGVINSTSSFTASGTTLIANPSLTGTTTISVMNASGLVTLNGGLNSTGANTLAAPTLTGTTTATTINASGKITNGGFDFFLGNTDQASRGDSGLSRALVKDSGNKLVINFGGDFTGGVVISSDLDLQGDLVSTGDLVSANMVPNSSVTWTLTPKIALTNIARNVGEISTSNNMVTFTGNFEFTVPIILLGGDWVYYTFVSASKLMFEDYGSGVGTFKQSSNINWVNAVIDELPNTPSSGQYTYKVRIPQPGATFIIPSDGGNEFPSNSTVEVSFSITVRAA
jgi:hypothetical protein